ncbi:NepR family anti-sigma factor [Zavarzinia sp.]|uniref:NepR family anti-sigma factor n=1 Tax=Zavarzinia sp. TaxID=2027920 RepID=UPI0035671804
MPEKSKSSKAKGEAKAKPVPEGWVDDRLRRLYDDVAAEPLPQDLLDLLDSIDLGQKPDNSGRDGSGGDK